MRLLALLVFVLFCAYALMARWYFVCEVRQLCGEELPADIRRANLTLTEGDSVILQGYDQFAFGPGETSPRLNDNNQAFLDTLAAILRDNSGRNLTITAYYRPQEKDIAPGFFENIGLARGDQLRKLLMKKGIAQSRFSLDHGLSEDSLLLEPLAFSLYDPRSLPEGYDKEVFTFENMTYSGDANFAYNSDEFKPDAPLQLYADSVKTYLELNPEADLKIIGHTDSIGSDAYNLDLGLRRAQNARRYFQELGVSADITVESMGKSRPVAPNSMPNGDDNPEGRQKNRRVNFVLSSPNSAENAEGEILEDASDLN